MELSFALLLSIISLLPQTLSSPIHSTTSASSVYNCTSFILPVPVSNITTIVPPFPYPFPDGYAATAFANLLTVRDPVQSKPALNSVTKTFNISVEYCTPKSPSEEASTIQLLTHGLGFDKTYWDFRLPNSANTTYSYINSALSAGYSTLSWDRLGCGSSTIADPYTEIQGTVELALLTELTGLLRSGKISDKIAKPKKIIHVGHSWGSTLTNALAATSPALSDGVVLTGYSNVFDYLSLFIASTGFQLASTNLPHRFGKQSSGYLTWGDEFSFQYTFFDYPYFDTAVLEYAERTRWPFTVGEFISNTAIGLNASSFTGPVLYFNGDSDLIFCGDDCKGLLTGPTSAAIAAFKASQSVETYIQPHTGHGINMHYNATAGFDVVMDWASRHGF